MAMIEGDKWFYEISEGVWGVCSEWEADLFETALVQNHDTVEYIWTFQPRDAPVQYVEYVVDLAANPMTQTNKTTGKVRTIMHLRQVQH